MLRFFIAALYAVLIMILSLPVHLYFRILARRDKMKSRRQAGKYVRGFFKGVLFLSGTKVTVKGAENLPEADVPVLFVSNHRSYFDIIVLQTLVDRPMGFIAKKEFRKVPLFSWYMKDIGCFFLDRKDARAALGTIRDATEAMKEGLSIGLYPEGTRNHGDTLLPFKEGGYRIAEKSGAPIVVTTLTNTDRILELNRPCVLRRAEVTVTFEKPVKPGEMSREDRKAYYASIPELVEKAYRA